MKCKHCNKNAELKSYREVNDVTTSEIVCDSCSKLSNEVLSLKTTLHLLEEGDDYWFIETINGVTHLSNSCKDEESEVIGNKDIFKTIDDGLEYLCVIGENDVRISNMRTNKIFDIEIKKVL